LEIKKSYQADLENKRPTAFLLGFILAFALIFVGLQYKQQPQTYDDIEELFDDLTQDLEMKPLDEKKDMVSAEPSAPVSKAVTEKIKAVEKVEKEPEKISPNTSELLVGDGKGTVDNAEVTAAIPQTPATLEDESVELYEEDILPQFPGGWAAFTQWLTKNLRYPPIAKQKKIQGEVAVTFIVNKDGTVADIKVVKSVDPILDREAIRVMKKMPKWKPGIIKNKPCRSMMAVPIVFSL